MRVLITRINDNGVQTIGKLTVYNGFDVVFECDTLELPYKDNMRSKSCIPTGKYKVITSFSNKYQKPMYEILDVKDRAGIRIHSGNYNTDINGCILVGRNFKDINNDGQLDILQSFDTLTKLIKKAGIEFELEII